MANLIIKPTSGGSLVLQDEGGTAANTIDASGNTTLAGTANNLGTVATMTLPTASATAVYPVGHVVQTTTSLSSNTETTINSSNNTWVSTVVTGSITPIFANSSIIIHGNWTSELNDSSGDIGLGFRFWRSASGITDSYPTGTAGFDPTATNVHSQWYSTPHNYTVIEQGWDYTFMDNNVTIAGTPVTYTLYAAGYGLGSSCKVGAPYGGMWTLFFQEIKR